VQNIIYKNNSLLYLPNILLYSYCIRILYTFEPLYDHIIQVVVSFLFYFIEKSLVQYYDVMTFYVLGIDTEPYYFRTLEGSTN